MAKKTNSAKTPFPSVDLEDLAAEVVGEEFQVYDENVPGCCSTQALSDLGCNGILAKCLSALEDSAHNFALDNNHRDPSKAQMRAAIKQEVISYFESKTTEFCTIAFLDSDQSEVKDLMLEAGFKVLATYPGRNSTISILAHGVTRSRQRS